MSDRIVARRENGCAAMSVGESGPAPGLTDGSVGVGAAPRAAVHPERFGFGPHFKATRPFAGKGCHSQHAVWSV